VQRTRALALAIAACLLPLGLAGCAASAPPPAQSPAKVGQSSQTLSADVTSSPCAASALALTVAASFGGATGETETIVAVKNDGARCSLRGYPTIAVLHGRTVLQFQYTHGRRYVTHGKPRSVVLAHAGTGYFLFAKYRCDVHTSAVSTGIKIQLPGEHLQRPMSTSIAHGAKAVSLCSGNGEPDPGNAIDVSPIERTRADLYNS
jgi:hypothetical protein